MNVIFWLGKKPRQAVLFFELVLGLTTTHHAIFREKDGAMTF